MRLTVLLVAGLVGMFALAPTLTARDPTMEYEQYFELMQQGDYLRARQLFAEKLEELLGLGANPRLGEPQQLEQLAVRDGQAVTVLEAWLYAEGRSTLADLRKDKPATWQQCLQLEQYIHRLDANLQQTAALLTRTQAALSEQQQQWIPRLIERAAEKTTALPQLLARVHRLNGYPQEVYRFFLEYPKAFEGFPDHAAFFASQEDDASLFGLPPAVQGGLQP